MLIRFGKLFAVQAVNALPKACITERNGGISAVKILINSFSLGNSCKSAVLPKNGSGIGKSAGKSFVTSLERSVAKLHSLIENLTEFIHIAPCRESYINKVDGYDALVESSVILWLSVLVNVAGVAPKVRSDILEMTEESYDYVMGINTKGTLFLTQAVASTARAAITNKFFFIMSFLLLIKNPNPNRNLRLQ